MRATLLLLIVGLGGCVFPLSSRLQRDPLLAPIDPRSRSVAPEDVPCSDSVRTWSVVACSPDAFNGYLAERPPSAVDVWTLDGAVSRGDGLRVRRDTAFLGAQAIPMERVDALELIRRRDAVERLALVGGSTAVVAGIAGTLRLIGTVANPDGEGAGVLKTAAGGAFVGLAFGLLANAGDPGQPFAVEGWLDPSLAPDAPGLLARDGSTSVMTWGVTDGAPACGATVPDGAGYVTRCTPPDVLTTRSGGSWVDRVTVQLRDGGHLTGRDLVVTDDILTLDGASRSLSAVERVELQALDGRWHVLRRTAKGAFVGVAYGLALGAGIAALSGDTEPLWVTPAVIGGLGAGGGLTVGLVRGRARVRDVTFVPEPGP